MEKIVAEFVSKLSKETQELIEDSLFTQKRMDNYLLSHQGKFLFNNHEGYILSPVKEERIIGEFNASEIEFAIIIEDVFLKYLQEQKESVRCFKQSMQCMIRPLEREIRDAQKYLSKLNNRLQVLFNEHDEIANYTLSLISTRLKKEIQSLLDRDESIDKYVYRYNAHQRSWGGYAFRVCNGNKILLHNQIIAGGD